MHKNQNFRTDLACEAIQRYQENICNTITEEITKDKLKITKTVVGLEDEELVGKKKGTYFAIDLSNTNFHDTKSCMEIEKALMDVLCEILKENNLINKKCLVIGLGNINVTPDSLGPYVLDNLVVTRHLFKMDTVNVGYSEVSGLTPGVMGATGIETFDIIQSVVNKIGVDYVIVVDALASASISRVNKTIQVTDTGISPGSGVGNKRKELSIETLGIPVIAVGVPTVVDAVTIVSDSMDYIVKYLNQKRMGTSSKANALTVKEVKIDYEEASCVPENFKEHLMGQIGMLEPHQVKALVEDVLSPNGYNMIVTPKEIDADVEDLAKILAMAINITLHESLRKSYLG
ncbi:MAG: GPR endopeptidase [Bacilli bacterium]|nr:GPR endopeptidase [Bacilli bacterium]